MPASQPPKTRAKLQILNEVLSFPTIRNKDWTSDFSLYATPQIGDLVSMSSAPPTKWYLSWLVDYEEINNWPRYLLESIEDGELCWWSNVGINFYNRDRVRESPQWRWTDAQFAFRDRWMRVGKKNDAYIVLPSGPMFSSEDNSVTLSIRIRFGFSDYSNHRTWPNWKKVTIKMMDDYYKECEAEYENSKIKPASSLEEQHANH